MEIIEDGGGSVVAELLGISVICAGIVTDPHLPSIQLTISSSTLAKNENRDMAHVNGHTHAFNWKVLSCIQNSPSQSQESA